MTGNYTRLIKTTTTLLLDACFACSGYYFFGRKAIDYSFIGASLWYVLLCIIPNVIYLGPIAIFKYIFILNPMGISTRLFTSLEVNDYTFSLGMFFIYYFIFEDKQAKHHKSKILVTIVLILFGFKRIQILSLLFIFLFNILINRKQKYISYWAIVVYAVFLFSTLSWIFMIDAGALEQLALKYKIEFSGRLAYYAFASKYFTFNLGYIGLGFTYFTKYFNELYLSGYRIAGHLIAATVHSDILNMYIELGMIPYILWITYKTLISTLLIEKNFKGLSGRLYLLVTIYLLITYLTDNTLTYSLTQTFGMLIIVIYCAFCKNELSVGKTANDRLG